MTYKQKILTKEYFKLCIEKKGEKYLKENSWLLLKFIRTFQPALSYPEIEYKIISNRSRFDKKSGSKEDVIVRI